MKKLLIIQIILLIIVGCTKKQELITPEKLLESNEIVIADSISENNKMVSDTFIPTEEIINEPEPVAVEEIFPEEEVEEIPEIIEVSEPQTSIQREFDYDQLFPDSIWTEYMTKRGDYLSLIAYKEYNNANEWRRIYQWNREHWEEKGIGPDRDNPNFIYPYRELDLKKPAENAIEWAYDSYNHVVESGETLWTIAQKEYGDELAWVVLFWDNEDLLNSQDGKLIPGMQLKVRSELWPEVE
ncbi:MAG: LysM peptidoglycan-binding domain-containing protein [Candidatus Marinimicrobia bacterium]|nr:LysM peptidoglycan-binding domain-containing protein [Candidatus Neomarinimicrobiota bacterium]